MLSVTEDTRLTIDELARRAGMTVRNVRAHQSRGLLPPPEIRGRTGYYGAEHADRLELIKDLQAEGFSLEVIGRILERSPGYVRLVPRPAVVEQHAWVLLPPHCGLRPDGGWKPTPSGRSPRIHRHASGTHTRRPTFSGPRAGLARRSPSPSRGLIRSLGPRS